MITFNIIIIIICMILLVIFLIYFFTLPKEKETEKLYKEGKIDSVEYLKRMRKKYGFWIMPKHCLELVKKVEKEKEKKIETTIKNEAFDFTNDLAIFKNVMKSTKTKTDLQITKNDKNKTKDNLGLDEASINKDVTASYEVKEVLALGIFLIEVTLKKGTETAKKQFVLNSKIADGIIPKVEIDKMQKEIKSTETKSALDELKYISDIPKNQLGLSTLLKSGESLQNGVINDDKHYLIKVNNTFKLITILKKDSNKIAYVITIIASDQ